MCVNKLYIRNNKLDFDPLIDSPYNYVPCGQCEECLRNRSLQYEIRSIYEYEYTNKIGGVTYYYTLTYNNDSVPKFHGVNVCSKYDCQLFLKRLRKSLHSKGYATNFRYFLSSEYGHKTLRPHYHILFFFPYNISSVVLLDMIRKTWNNGFVCPGWNLGKVIDVRPFHYVAKYVQKDIFYFKQIESKGLSQDDFLDYKLHKKEFYSHLDILPFHLQSSGFGSSLLDILQDSDYINGYFVRVDSLGVSRKVPVPLYIYRLKFYDRYVNDNGNISYILNADGFDVMSKRLKKQFDHYSLLYIDALSNSLLNFYELKLPKKIFFTYEAYETFVNFARSKDFSKSLACYSLLWSRSSHIPFLYRSFDEDLSIYFKTLSDYPFMPKWLSPHECSVELSSNDKTYLELLLHLCDESISYLKYSDYVRQTQLYNVKQYDRSSTSGKLKLATVKSYSEFVNLKKSNLCLSILQRKDVG